MHIVGNNVALDVVDVAERDMAVELVAGRVVEAKRDTDVRLCQDEAVPLKVDAHRPFGAACLAEELVFVDKAAQEGRLARGRVADKGYFELEVVQHCLRDLHALLYFC